MRARSMAEFSTDGESMAMPRQAKQGVGPLIAPESGAAPARPRLAADVMGQAGSAAALARIDGAVAELRAIAARPLLQRALTALGANDFQAGAEWAIKALEQDERNGFAWYLLAFAREGVGDFVSSIRCYESALALLPDEADVANDLGRLAYRMGMIEQAEKLFRMFVARRPENPEGANNLACALRSLDRHEEAIDVLKASLTQRPGVSIMWNTLGTIVNELGDLPTAVTFFEEALRLEPTFPKARYNLANAKLALGDADAACEDCEAALAMGPAPADIPMMRLAHSTILLCAGRLGEGWDAYEARFDPNFPGSVRFLVDRPRWEPGVDLAGKSLLVFGEQGLGDEVLFANTLPDVIERLGPDGRLIIAVEPRLVALFQRSFPKARVGAHESFKTGAQDVRLARFVEPSEIDIWTPIASLLRGYRRGVDRFPARERFMQADPARVAYWRDTLQAAPPGRRVGLLWKSAIKSGSRQRFYSPFDRWEPVLRTPGVSFVNLQYGDCEEEIAYAKAAFGVDIWTPPGVDLKQDLDEVAALACAVDLTIGFSNASLNLGGACGAATWLISAPGAWPRLGTTTYPWYPQVRVYAPETFGDWDEAMVRIAADLAAFAAEER